MNTMEKKHMEKNKEKWKTWRKKNVKRKRKNRKKT